MTFVEKLQMAINKQEDDDVLFSEIISLAANDYSDQELSELFTVAIVTINRWKKGLTTPHYLIKPVIYESLLKRYG